MVTTTHRAGGIDFNFDILPASTRNWPSGAGLYALSRWNASTKVNEILYVGQANSFSGRLPTHERWDEATRAGMTDVLVTSVPLQADRDKLEQILIRDLNPPMNTHHKPGLRGLQ